MLESVEFIEELKVPFSPFGDRWIIGIEWQLSQ